MGHVCDKFADVLLCCAYNRTRPQRTVCLEVFAYPCQHFDVWMQGEYVW